MSRPFVVGLASFALASILGGCKSSQPSSPCGNPKYTLPDDRPLAGEFAKLGLPPGTILCIDLNGKPSSPDEARHFVMPGATGRGAAWQKRFTERGWRYATPIRDVTERVGRPHASISDYYRKDDLVAHVDLREEGDEAWGVVSIQRCKPGTSVDGCAY
jgi:hypothetical protein